MSLFNYFVIVNISQDEEVWVRERNCEDVVFFTQEESHAKVRKLIDMISSNKNI